MTGVLNLYPHHPHCETLEKRDHPQHHAEDSGHYFLYLLLQLLSVCVSFRHAALLVLIVVGCKNILCLRGSVLCYEKGS